MSSLTHQEKTFRLPKRVVLVGGSGFIGKALEPILQARGSEVLSLSSKQLDLADPSCVARLKEIVRPDDAVVYLACITPDRGKDAAAFVKNCAMAKHFSDFVEQASFSHLVTVSSDAIYNDDQNPVNESSYCAPSSFYGCAHLARELMVKAAASKSKIRHVVVRPSAVYGLGDTHNGYGPNRFFKTALSQGKIQLFGQGEEKRDHIAIGDVCQLLVLILGHHSTGVLNLVTGNAVSFMEVAELIAKKVGPAVQVEGSPRANPITYRHFDITSTIQAFPQFQWTSLDVGVTALLEQLRRG